LGGIFFVSKAGTLIRVDGTAFDKPFFVKDQAYGHSGDTNSENDKCDQECHESSIGDKAREINT